MLWLKAFHLIFVTSWFAGLFYLPRLFVYHAMATDQATRDQLKIMERKLYRFMTLLALFAVGFGALMTVMNWDYYRQAYWLHAKLTIVLLLIVYHWLCGRLVGKFKNDQNTNSHVFYRWFNEIPIVMLFIVVILAVVKPF